MTDHWSKQTGLIVPGFEIGFCTATAAVTEGYGVKVGTHVTQTVPITLSAGVGDSVGVVLKTAGIGEICPVCFYGVMRMDTTSAVTIGNFVIGASGGATVLGIQAAGGNTYANYKAFGGASYILGMALQTATSGDEILILIGKCL